MVAVNKESFLKITKEDVRALIEVERENTLLQHLRGIIFKSYFPMGTITSDKIEIWQPHSFLTFYPVYTFQFNSENKIQDFTYRLNPASKGIAYLPLIFLFGVSCFLIISNDFSFLNMIMVLSGGIIYTLLYLILRASYKFETKKQLRQIFEVLKVEVAEEPPEKEWTFSKIMTRLFLYPFCIGLFSLGIYLLISGNQYILMIPCLMIPVFYFYVDLKILFKKKT